MRISLCNEVLAPLDFERQCALAAALRGDASIEPFVYKPDGPACAARGIGYIRGILEAQA